MGKTKVSIIIPTYNEADNIELLLDRLAEILDANGLSDYEIITVDDNSPDGTCDIVRAKSRENPKVKCILRVKEKGLSSAVVEGFRNASGEILVVMDADLQHPPEVIPRLVRAIENGADVAVATRYGRGGGVAGWSRLRLLMSRIATLGVKILIREAKRTTDPLSGFFAVRRGSLNLDGLKPKGFKILLEILARHPCLKVVDIPYVFQRRHSGESKLGFFVVTDFISQSWEISPMPKFLIVGASGILVNLLTMWLVLRLTGHVDIASMGGIEASIVSNFVLHELVTFRHYFRRDCRDRSAFMRLILYHRASLASIATTYIVMKLLVTFLGTNPLLGQFLGILLGFIVNYLLSVETVWECGIHGGCKRGLR